ncbi:hypothetical protein [Nocardioides sp. Soil774]|uniref:hypothetical protein n=1 Tax=Nocardioides sp. Soil774 TaxID=1736408 RepID=UPI0012FB8028|nr:hypothetical protein [Nocardioides sp. Soil774]
MGALLLVAIGFVVAALGADPAARGAYVGMAVLVGSAALAATGLLLAIERRRRRG